MIKLDYIAPLMLKNNIEKLMSKDARQRKIAIFESNDGQISFNVNVFDETVWLTQKQMSQLFEKSQPTISEHIKNIFIEGELEEKSVYRNFRYTATDSKEYFIKHYNLDVIISVGYRVKSSKGIKFRKWATNILKQHLLNGYSVSEIRIKKIQSSLDELAKSNKINSGELSDIKKLLKQLLLRPIIIQNQHQINNSNNINLDKCDIEEKTLKAIDKIILKLQSLDTQIDEFREIRNNVIKCHKNKSAKNKVAKFVADLSDEDSNLNKKLNRVKGLKNLILNLKELLSQIT